MTDTCIIGPVSIENAHLFDSSTFSFSNSASQTITAGGVITQRGQFAETYEFAIDCTFEQALQLKGVVEQGQVIWINTSDLTDNDYLQHKGWVILTQLDISEQNPWSTCECKISYIKISDYEGEYLTMDYSRGLFDGVNITPTYNVTNSTTLLNESGSATTNWTALRYGYTKRGTPTTKTFTSDGTEFDITLACKNTPEYNSVYDFAWSIYNKSGQDNSFTLPFTLIYDMDYNTLASSSALKSMGVGLCPTNYGVTSGYFNNRRNQFFETYFDITSGAKYGVRTRNGSSTINFKPATSFSASNQTIRFKLEFGSDSKVRVSVDIGVTGSYTQIYYGTSGLTNYSSGLYVYMWVANNSTSSWTGSFRNFTMTRDSTPSFPNIVMMPANATLQDTVTTGSRALEDGTGYYYVNPSTEKRYKITASDYYDGSVKLLSSNNAVTTSKQVFSTEHKLTPTTTILKNGMTRLVFNANGYDLQAYYSGAWNTINTITYIGGLSYIKPLYVDSERVVMQLNDTKLTMLRSSPIVTVEHPNTTLEYTLKDRYTTGSGTTSSPSAGTSIDMLADTDYYMTVYNSAASDYRLLFVKKDPCSIYSDSLPADTITGIGWVSNSGSGYETAVNQALSWYKQTRTGISLKQII